MVSKRLLYLVRRWLTKKTKRKSPINSWPWIRSQLYRILLNPKTDRIHLQISAAISTSSPKKWLTSGELSSSKAFFFSFCRRCSNRLDKKSFLMKIRRPCLGRTFSWMELYFYPICHKLGPMPTGRLMDRVLCFVPALLSFRPLFLESLFSFFFFIVLGSFVGFLLRIQGS